MRAESDPGGTSWWIIEFIGDFCKWREPGQHVGLSRGNLKRTDDPCDHMSVTVPFYIMNSHFNQLYITRGLSPPTSPCPPRAGAGCRGPWVPNSTRLGWTTGQQAWPWGAGALGESGHRGASWVLGQSGASAVSRGGGVASGRGAHGYPRRQLDVHAPSRGPFSRASSGQSGRNIPTSGGAGDGAGQLRARLVRGPPRMTGHAGPHARLCLALGPRLATSPCPGLPTPVRAGMSPLPA